MSDYQQLAARFGEVRTSWKRTAALSGLAIVITESIGILTVMLFLDWLYQPRPLLRVSMWMLALAGIAWFVMRHVFAPLARNIPDEQIALYIEEHRDDLDGVMITAAEYGQKRDGISGGQAALIDAVMNEATARARATINHVVDLSRLKKYCVGAVVGVGIYILLCILFPNAIGHHVGRILQPWRTTAEDLPKRPASAVLLEPIKFTFSKEDARLARGTSFDFEVILSRRTDKPVALNFRPVAGGDKAAWQTLPMTEIEKLNGFQGTLPDVSEDLEFYVSTGMDKSETHKLTVFDPLVIQSLEVTTHYPAYVKLQDRVESPSSGDVEALTGSTVTVRINASTPLKEGKIKWSNGTSQPVTVDAKASTGATFSFEVKEDATYEYALTDANGQQAVSASAFSVKAIADEPPTLDVKSPKPPVLTNPVGEVNFEIEAGDDFGVAGVDLVYTRFDADGKAQETRMPLTLSPGDAKAAPNAVRSTYTLMLENMKPPLKFEDAIPYHLEVRDAKGQKAISDIGIIVIGYFEAWATWGTPHGPEPAEDAGGPDLMAILSMTWLLDGQKAKLPPVDYKKQAQEIAEKMTKDGGLRDFVDLKHMPQLAKVKPVINAHAAKAHEALAAGDTGGAVAELSVAAALYAGNKILQDMELAKEAASQGGGAGGIQQQTMTLLEKARLDALKEGAQEGSREEQEKAESKAAAAAGKDIEDLMKKQDEVVANAKAQAGGQAGKTGAQPASKGAAGDLSKSEQGLSEKTKDAADKAKAGADSKAGAAAGSKLKDAADKTGDAAKMMGEAAKSFAAGKMGEGAEKAAAAQKTLQEAHDTLQNTGRDKLEAAISEAAGLAATLLDKQRTLRADTEKLAKEIGEGKTPDQRQKRDLGKQAYQETYLRVDAEALNNDIVTLGTWATQVGQPEAIRALGEAQKTIKRSQPEVKMGGAVVDLNNAAPASAAEGQKKAEDAVQKIIDDLHNGSDALAASKDAQLRRAQRAAAEVKKGLEQLMNKDGKAGEQAKAGEQGKTGNQPGEQAKAGEQGKAGNQPGEQAKAGEQGKAGNQPGEQAKAGEQGKAGNQPGEQAKAGEQGKAGNQPGEQAKAGEQGKAGNQPGEQGKAGEQAKAGEQGKAGNEPGAQAKNGQGAGAQSGGGPKQTLQKLAYDMQRLATNLDNRDLVSQKDVDQLKEMSMDKAELEKRLATDPKLLSDVSGMMARINDKLEAASQAKTEASKLFSSQREECPPAYRQFVNQYFEALSQAGRAPQQRNKP